MSYDGKLMRRAMVRFEEAKQRRADALHARERAVYAAVPRIAEIDAALRETMSKLISSALRRGTDPRPAIEALKEENLALQRERAELLVAHGYPADYLEDKPNCPLCGDTGWRGSEVCSCLNDYYARVQLEELSRLLDLGTQSFETFSFDVYSPYAPLDQDISPRSNMERIYDACTTSHAAAFSPPTAPSPTMPTPSGTFRIRNKQSTQPLRPCRRGCNRLWGDALSLFPARCERT